MAYLGEDKQVAGLEPRVTAGERGLARLMGRYHIKRGLSAHWGFQFSATHLELLPEGVSPLPRQPLKAASSARPVRAATCPERVVRSPLMNEGRAGRLFPKGKSPEIGKTVLSLWV